tara:strand:+ start:1598 stop:1861 length:264 start_codon:yes stop_codon:yes gene_type:complete
MSVSPDEFKRTKQIINLILIQMENKNCPCCNEPMIKTGTRVIIVDNFHEHLNYKNEITIITGHDDYGNYILDNRWICSEAEIQTINN